MHRNASLCFAFCENFAKKQQKWCKSNPSTAKAPKANVVRWDPLFDHMVNMVLGFVLSTGRPVSRSIVLLTATFEAKAFSEMIKRRPSIARGSRGAWSVSQVRGMCHKWLRSWWLPAVTTYWHCARNLWSGTARQSPASKGRGHTSSSSPWFEDKKDLFLQPIREHSSVSSENGCIEFP